MNIEINNCNNIATATIALAENKLNIKFAPNGTGKSTIAQAIICATDEKASLDELMPFKLRESNPDEKQPTVAGVENLNIIACFNEDYVNQFVFKQDELLSNSFDILIRTDAYKEKEREIEELVAEIKQIFSNNPELDKFISTLKEMSAAFKLTQTGISRSSTGMKALASGNKIQHIPAGLEAYQPFIQSQNSVGWVDWQTKGYAFSELSDNCPFCTSQTRDRMEQIQKVGQEYDKNTIKNLINIIEVIDRLGEYFSDEARARLSAITTLQDGVEDEHIASLVTIKTQIDILASKLEKLKTISGFQFKEDERVAEKLPSYKIDLLQFSELNSTATREVIAPLNASIDEIQTGAGQLQGSINQQRREIQRVIEKHQTDINNFLAYAGYKYKVEIAGENEKAQLKLLHIDHSEHLSGGTQHLSFGERNAFSIILFMYECLSKKPDLIILDDPISSFDKNKKYAILEMLFRRDAGTCLKNKTVLMLTHDVEPIIDTVKSLKQFENQTAASFLKLSGDEITEQDITKDDIQTFAYICTKALDSNKCDLVKIIYLRRHYEITDDKGNAYQVLSNLFKKRTTLLDSREPRNDEGLYPELEASKKTAGHSEIAERIAGFSYEQLVSDITDINNLKSIYAACNNGYEKLQVFRLFGMNTENSVIKKFINETYHIENEFICQLDPAKFDTIPEYVINECDKVLQEEAQ